MVLHQQTCDDLRAGKGLQLPIGLKGVAEAALGQKLTAAPALTRFLAVLCFVLHKKLHLA